MKSVLIVEDYENIKNLYTDAFIRAGYDVETAESGSAGFAKTQQREFDVVILDMLMLGLSGLEFMEAFEPLKHPKTKVVVVSNLDSPDIIQKAQALGAVKYLIKSSYTPKELVEVIETLPAS